LITVELAHDLIRENVSAVGAERVGMSDLCGRVLVVQTKSPIDLPIFANSAVDGYAIRTNDSAVACKCKLIGNVPAGQESTQSLSPGEAIRVFTGSPIPDGTEAVVMQEDVQLHGDVVVFRDAPRPRSHIRRQGEEVRRGDLVFEKETLITPAVLGVLASLGLQEALVFRRPRVAIVGNGNELVPPGSRLGPGQIFESNTLAISAAVTAIGGEVVSSSSVRDDKEVIVSALGKALEESDVVITCGGVSVGDHDLVRDAAFDLGVEEVFWRVAMRPGKPLFFGRGAQGQLFFGLPGNPVSALVTFYIFVAPALKRMASRPQAEMWRSARLAAPIRTEKGRTDFVRAKAKPGIDVVLEPIENQGSNMLTGLACAEYLIHVPADVDHLEAGATVVAGKIDWGVS
jgi:molybdopterin molybdotransferase